MSKRRCLLMYDIRDPKRLVRAAKSITQVGTRVQKSLYEIDSDETVIRRLVDDLKRIGEEEDSILLIPLCEDDWADKKAYGKGAAISGEAKSYAIL
jgi:CRISPR-associated protein Cas2